VKVYRIRHQKSLGSLFQSVEVNIEVPTTSESSVSNGQNSTLIHDISWIDPTLFSPGCKICQVQFKHVFRDYVVSREVLAANRIEIGEFIMVKSHINSVLLDMGVITAIYSVSDFYKLKEIIGKSLDAEENYVGTAVRLATLRERQYLPVKWEREATVLQIAKQVVYDLGLGMNLYEAEFQFDGKILFLYYTGETRVDYRELVHEMVRVCGNTRVKMKKTNQCRQYNPVEFATYSMKTGLYYN